MKKLLGILVLGLLWCNVGFAKVFDFKCSSFSERKYVKETYKREENYDYKIMIHVQLDTSQKTIKIFSDWDSEESHDIYKIDETIKMNKEEFNEGIEDIVLNDEKILLTESIHIKIDDVKEVIEEDLIPEKEVIKEDLIPEKSVIDIKD